MSLVHPALLGAKPLQRRCLGLAPRGSRRIFDLMPDSSKIVRYTLEVLAIVTPLAGMTYFLFDPDAFNAFMDWLFRIL
jgi:hypothetical protein